MSDVVVSKAAAKAAAAKLPVADAPAAPGAGNHVVLYVGLGLVAVLLLVVGLMWYRVRKIEQRNAELRKFLDAVVAQNSGQTPAADDADGRPGREQPTDL